MDIYLRNPFYRTLAPLPSTPAIPLIFLSRLLSAVSVHVLTVGMLISGGCDQAILDCSDTNEGFYVKCGYERKGLQMAHYYDK